ncbi:hypothetical protein [Candidatus Coxiella mudrowiae]|uniref:hypothetical protein n=1 Tax=Candidatus Coxiella mudrowiae TaxID=2054173 RepID=UPI001F2427E3|nr:hypothetical protein [Candidatus Coxiella mudrowiae]
MAGYVTKIAFTPGGTFVKTGSVLIQLDNRKQQDDVAAAQADLELSQLQFQRDLKALKQGLILQATLYNDEIALDKD